MNAAKANSSIGPLEPVIFWSTLARAVVGGIFGLIVYLVYLLYTQPYFLSGSQPENLLVAGGNGFLVGIFIFSLGRWLGSNPGIALRIISAIVFSFFTMAS